MRRILFASVFFILTLLLGVLVPFGNTNKAYAINANVILGTNDDEDYCGANYCSGSDTLKINQVTTTYATGAVLPLSINLINAEGEGGPSKKIGTTDLNIVNWTDLEDTIWDAFYDSSFRTDSENGFFLVISKSKVTRTDDSFSDEVVGPGESFTIDGPAANDQKIKTANGLGDNKGRSIGYLLYGIDPQTYFFNKLSFSPNAQITGLDPSTTYYAQIVVEEDGSDDYFWSNIVEFQTKATTDPGASPPSGTNATGYDQTQPPPQNADTVIDFGCSLGIGLGESNISGCFVELFYIIFWKVSAFILLLTGKLFDAIAAISLGSGIYSGQIATFVTSGWTIVRDIANIFFIFILLYTALGLVLSLHSVDPKKLISKVIITALLINFSLFFCRVVVDTSNILALNFYNAMDISTKGNEASTTTISTGVKEKSISGAVANGINPQKILSEDSLNNLAVKEPGTLFFVILIGTVLNFMLAWIFFMCAAFFAGRIGVIWLSMIFAPIALVTGIVPTLSKAAKRLGWEEWLSAFLKACFNAPIFMFFMYLIVRLTNETNLSETLMAATDSKNIILIVISVLLPAMIIIGLMQAAKKIAEEMAGEFGAAFSGIVAAGVGVAAMAATGGAARVLSAGGGIVGEKLQKSQTLQNLASGKTKLGGNSSLAKWTGINKLGEKGALVGMKAGNKMQTGSFDVRQTGVGNLLSKATGVNMNMGSAIPGLGGLSTASTAGGAIGRQNREAEQIRKDSELFSADKDAIHKIDHEKDEKTEENSAIKKELEKDGGPKEELEKAEREKQKAQNAIDAYKNANGKDAKVPKDRQDALDKANQKVDDINHNKTITVNVKQPDGSTKAVTFKGLKAAEKQSNKNETRIKDLEGMRTNAEKAGPRQFMLNKMKQSGYAVEGTKTDEFGNIKNLGHINYDKRVAEEAGKNAVRDLFKGMAQGAASGAAVGSIIPGAGTAVGAVVGGTFGGVMGGLTGYFGKEDGEAAHIAGDSKHSIHLPKDSYKSPSSGFFDMFKGLGGSSGGGGGGGGDHGGGHDDHGGAHH